MARLPSVQSSAEAALHPRSSRTKAKFVGTTALTCLTLRQGVSLSATCVGDSSTLKNEDGRPTIEMIL